MKKACFILLAAAALAAGVLAWNAMDKAAGKEAAAELKRQEDFAKWRAAIRRAEEGRREREGR
jgi:Ni/Co efflux regulator RcnB